MRSKLMSVCLLVLCACQGMVLADNGNPAVGWSQLVFEAADGVGRVRVGIELAPADLSELHDAVAAKGLALLPQRGGLQRLSADIQARAFLLDKTWRGQVWFQLDGTALQRTRFKPGEDGDFRRYRYTSEGVSRRRVKPQNSEQAALPPDRWGKVKDKFIPFGSAKQTCGPIFDVSGLLYTISAHGLEPELGTGICVFNKKSLYRVKLVARDTPPVKLTLQQGPGELVSRLADGVDVRVIELQPQPLGGAGQEREAFEFMGLEGDIAVSLDRVTGLPLMLSGELPGLGRVRLELTEVRLRP